MFNKIIKKTIGLNIALLTVIPSLATASPAFALFGSERSNHCKDVYLSVVNGTGERIKIIDLHYYDPAKQIWRSEPIGNEEIAPGNNWQETRTLEKVNKKKIRISIRYRVEEEDGWSKKIDQWAPSRFVCDKNDSYEFTVTKTTPGEYKK